MRCYAITPVPAPRMVQSDKWQHRAPVDRYRTFRQLVQLNQVWLPVPFRHVVFVLPMFRSWDPREQARLLGQPHTQKPDRDNLEKALLDSVFGDDASIWDGRTTKIWGYSDRPGLIVVANELISFAVPFNQCGLLDAWYMQSKKDTRVMDVRSCVKRKQRYAASRNASANPHT